MATIASVRATLFAPNVEREVRTITGSVASSTIIRCGSSISADSREGDFALNPSAAGLQS